MLIYLQFILTWKVMYSMLVTDVMYLCCYSFTLFHIKPAKRDTCLFFGSLIRRRV